MGADYVKRIVARLSGAPGTATAPPIVPRGSVHAPADAAGDPFDAPATADSALTATVASPAALPVGPRFAPDGLTDSHPRLRPTPVRSEPTPPTDVPAIAREFTTRAIVEHERVIEHVVTNKETMALPSRDPDGDRPVPVEHDADATASIGRRAPMPRDQEPATHTRSEHGGEERPVAVRRDRVVASEDRRSVPVRPSEPRMPPPMSRRRESTTPLRPRPAPPVTPPTRPVRERSRLVIGRLVVEVVQPPAPALPRSSPRVTASAPRPFRADGPSSLTVGRASGLGQS
jgi:hypothetical protein